MNFEVQKSGNHVTIRLTCEKLDTTVAPALKSELVVLNTEGNKNIIIDLSSVRYCDSSGLSAILVGNRLCKNINGTLAICSLQEPVKKLIAISQLDTVLKITPTAKDAESAFLNGSATAKGAGSDDE